MLHVVAVLERFEAVDGGMGRSGDSVVMSGFFRSRIGCGRVASKDKMMGVIQLGEVSLNKLKAGPVLGFHTLKNCIFRHLVARFPFWVIEVLRRYCRVVKDGG